MIFFKNIWRNVDWILFGSVMILTFAGLVTMNSFLPGNSYFFGHQVVWLSISIMVFFLASAVDWSPIKNTRVVVTLFILSVVLLFLLFILGSFSRGARSWFNFGAFSLQPSDPIKLVVILILAKYFSRRHIEIANVRHILVSGFYAFVIYVLVFLQPDFGSAIIIFLLWFSMVLISGISKKHLLAVFLIGLLSFGGLWFLIFKPYQKDRIKNFIYPLTDIRGGGYNAYQSVIAIGSGEIFGKGIGYGTQSKLQFFLGWIPSKILRERIFFQIMQLFHQ